MHESTNQAGKLKLCLPVTVVEYRMYLWIVELYVKSINALPDNHIVDHLTQVQRGARMYAYDILQVACQSLKPMPLRKS